ncbi:MAG TPA: helix-turn-helix domain-containing protein [Ktedonobacterales bacterium]|nr:helix-turn-helix domain-containing protein [Ktedonobacterales bacterium]
MTSQGDWTAHANDPLLTTDDVASYLNVDVVTVRRLISKGEIGAYRIASEYRVRMSDLEDYLRRQYIPPKAKAEPAEPTTSDGESGR